MGFTATTQVTPSIVQTGNFYPDLSTQKMAETTRLDGSVNNARLESALSFATIKISRELKRWRLKCDYETLADYDIAHDGDKCQLFEFAVFSEARAMLTEQYKDYDSTPDKTARSKELESSIDEYRRNARHAITMFYDDFDDGKQGGNAQDDGSLMTIELI